MAKKTKDYAGFWPRLGAHILDNIFESVIPGIMFLIGIGLADANPTAGVSLILLAFPLYIVITIFNEWIMVAKTGQSLGKKAAGLMIQDKAGEKLSYGMAFVRMLVKHGCFFFGLIGALVYTIPLIADSKERKSLGDLAASSFVVKEK